MSTNSPGIPDPSSGLRCLFAGAFGFGCRRRRAQSAVAYARACYGRGHREGRRGAVPGGYGPKLTGYAPGSRLDEKDAERGVDALSRRQGDPRV